jgi:hypothetical protein
LEAKAPKAPKAAKAPKPAPGVAIKRGLRAIKTDKTKGGATKTKTNVAVAAATINEPAAAANEPAALTNEPEPAPAAAPTNEAAPAAADTNEHKTDAQINADLDEFLSAYLGGTVDSRHDPDLTTIDLETGATLQPAPPGPVQNDTAGAPGTVHADAPNLVFFGGVLYVRVDALPQPEQPAQPAQTELPAKQRKPGSGRPLGSKDKQKRRKHDPNYVKPKGGPMGRPIGVRDNKKRGSKNNPKPAGQPNPTPAPAQAPAPARRNPARATKISPFLFFSLFASS